jgi:hypothetical protein
MQPNDIETPFGKIIRTSRHLFNDEDDLKSSGRGVVTGPGGVLRNITNLHTMNQPTANHSGNGSFSSFPMMEACKIDQNGFNRDCYLKEAFKESSFDHSSSEEDEDDGCFDENNARMTINRSINEGVDRMKCLN